MLIVEIRCGIGVVPIQYPRVGRHMADPESHLARKNDQGGIDKVEAICRGSRRARCYRCSREQELCRSKELSNWITARR